MTQASPDDTDAVGLPRIPNPDLDLEEFRRFLYAEPEILVIAEDRSDPSLDFERLLLDSDALPKRP